MEQQENEGNAASAPLPVLSAVGLRSSLPPLRVRAVQENARRVQALDSTRSERGTRMHMLKAIEGGIAQVAWVVLGVSLAAVPHWPWVTYLAALCVARFLLVCCISMERDLAADQVRVDVMDLELRLQSKHNALEMAVAQRDEALQRLEACWQARAAEQAERSKV